MLLWGAVMSARKSPSFWKPSPSKLRSQQGRIPASGSGGRQCVAHAKDGRFQPAPKAAVQQHADQIRNGEMIHKDVKNEECSSEFIENKGAKKVLLRV